MDDAPEAGPNISRESMPKVTARRRTPAGGFDLLRWYSAVSLVAIGAVAVIFALVGTRFVATETLHRDASLTAQFIESVMGTESRHAGFESVATLAEFLDTRVDPRAKGVTILQTTMARAEFYDHVGLLPDQLLVNVYAKDLTIVWSTNKTLIGKQDDGNDDLREAFSSKSMVAKGHLERQHDKKEQEFLVEPQKVFIENYIPLRSKQGDVVAVVEMYKEPSDLLSIIARGERLVWASSIVAAGLVYLVTFGIVRRGHRLLMAQQQKLLDNESLVTIGELSTAIAHSLRNPLASIRSSAELAFEDGDERTRKKANDIITQVDRLSGWIKDLLHYSRPAAVTEEPVALRGVVNEVLAGFDSQFKDRKINVRLQIADDLPPVLANYAMLVQALRSIVANAAEAIGNDGEIGITATRGNPRDRITLVVSDSGSGMTKEQLDKAFRPFLTTKQSGLGVGLSMVQQVMERFGGQVELASQKDVGTDVYLHMRTA